MSKCDYLVPQHGYPLVQPEVDSPECLLDRYHSEQHLIRLSGGKYVLWEPDYTCDCEDTDCGCFFWSYISESEANEILAKNDPQ